MPQRYDGQQLKQMFITATRWLEANSEAINSLNVFPVPDGDTGTNMLFTMRETLKEGEKCFDASASAVAKALAWGALMGARGNSGVILSQILRGLSKGLEGKKAFDGRDFACALGEAATSAYKAVSNPVEGTILTVITDSSRAAQNAAVDSEHLQSILEASVTAARESVSKTPTLLEVLREAGVVDAGGQGLLIILEGMLKHLKGEPVGGHVEAADSDAIAKVSKMGSEQDGEQVYGFCTQFIVHGKNLDLAFIREQVNQLGESTVVVGDEQTMRVHTHSFQPEEVIAHARQMGELSHVNVQNIDEQHVSFLQAQNESGQKEIAVVAVASGEGFREVFAGLGASIVVMGGQTMNPSTEELLTAIEAAPAPTVIVLPNNKNIVPAAQQAASMSDKKVEIVATTTIPQGIACVLSFNAEASLEENVGGMKEAKARVKTLELTRAVRPAKLNGLSIKEGEAIGIIDGKLVASASCHSDVIQSVASGLQSHLYNLATVYCGAQIASEAKDGVIESLKRCLPDAEVEVMDGGQKDYDFIISLE